LVANQTIAAKRPLLRGYFAFWQGVVHAPPVFGRRPYPTVSGMPVFNAEAERTGNFWISLPNTDYAQWLCALQPCFVRPAITEDEESRMPTLPRKQSVNVSIDRALLREARAMRLNLSRTLEERLAELTRHAGREQWLKKNREALEDYNQRIEQAGVFSDGLRRC